MPVDVSNTAIILPDEGEVNVHQRYVEYLRNWTFNEKMKSSDVAFINAVVDSNDFGHGFEDKDRYSKSKFALIHAMSPESECGDDESLRVFRNEFLAGLREMFHVSQEELGLVVTPHLDGRTAAIATIRMVNLPD